MGTIQASALINKTAKLLQDETNIRWPRAELLGWLDDGQREIVLHRPESAATTEAVSLTAGTTKQSIPTTGTSFIRLVRNMGANGVVAGKAVRLVSREIMDAQNPDWHSDTNSLGYVQHYVYDPLNPKVFYVYPKAPATTWYVEIIYSKTPTTLSSESSAISVDDIYANAMIDYTLFRAYSKDAEYAQNGQLAVAYYTSFANAVGLTISTAVDRNPNVLDGGSNPNVPKR